MGNTAKNSGIKRQKSSMLDVFKSNKQINPSTDKQHTQKELSVYGFIRKIGEELSSKQNDACSIVSLIPSSIYKLCYRYCINSNADYLYLWCASPIVENYISCINIKDTHKEKVYEFDLKQLNESMHSTFHDKKFSASFLVNNISNSIIPKQYNQMLNVSGNEICALFRIGGKFMIASSEESCITCGCNVILFNSPIANENYSINGYIADLPYINEANSCVASIYDPSQNIIYNVGGLNCMNKIQKGISSLNMNKWSCDDDHENFKWKKHEIKLNQQRYQTCLSWIGGDCHDNIMVCGGCPSLISPTNHCEMIRLDENNEIKEIVPVSRMNHERAFVGAFQCESHKIVIGGGILRESSAYTIEFFDGNVNKWIEYSHRTQFRHDQAILWCDSNNYNIIFIGGHNYSYLGNIEWIDIRDSSQTWHTLTNAKKQTQIFDFFKLAGKDEQISVDYWNRRHLLI